jgi:hypothetical protein
MAVGHRQRTAADASESSHQTVTLTRRSRLVVEVPNHGCEKRFRLTQAGLDMEAFVDQPGRWGQRWLASPELGDLDAEVLLRDICAQMSDRLPDRPLIVVRPSVPTGRHTSCSSASRTSSGR